MKSVQLLLDLGREKVGTDTELARRMGLTPQNLAGVRAGRRNMTIVHVAAVCDLLQLSGQEAREWYARIAVEQETEPSKVNLLKRALFACWALGVGVSLSTITTNDAQASVADASMTISTDGGKWSRPLLTPLEPTSYTLSRILARLIGWLRPAKFAPCW